MKKVKLRKDEKDVEIEVKDDTYVIYEVLKRIETILGRKHG